MSDIIVEYCYHDAKARPSTESSSRLWFEILLRYTRDGLGYKVENLDGNENEPSYIVVYSTKDRDRRDSVFFAFETASGHSLDDSAAWDRLRAKLTERMKNSRVQEGHSKDLFGITTIGTYTRFYRVKHNENEITEYHYPHGQIFEIRDDEEAIEWNLLRIIRDITYREQPVVPAGQRFYRVMASRGFGSRDSRQFVALEKSTGWTA